VDGNAAAINSAPIASSTAEPSDRTRLLLAQRRARLDKVYVRPTLSFDALYIPRRFPALSAAVLCYAGGWVLELAGNDLPSRFANSIVPKVLLHSWAGWPVLGLWLCAMLALLVLVASWIRSSLDS
jgi:hypothetical protein